jgi:hypothetical protein
MKITSSKKIIKMKFKKKKKQFATTLKQLGIALDCLWSNNLEPATL